MGRWNPALVVLVTVLGTLAGPAPSAHAATTWHVDDTQPPGVPDGSAAHPFPTIQAALNAASDGDTVLVEPGLYPESPVIAASIVLESTAGRAGTIIVLQPGDHDGALTITGSVVRVTGFEIVGFDAPNTAGIDRASVNVFVDLTADDVELASNRYLVGTYGPDSDFYDGIGVLTAEEFDGTLPIARLVVRDSEFRPLSAPLNPAANSAFYASQGLDRFEFLRNTVTGAFDYPSFTLAADGLVEGNTVTGDGSSGGIGAGSWTNPDLYGHTTFTGNTISGTANGIVLFSTNDVVITGNDLLENSHGILVLLEAAGFDGSTVHVHQNNFVGNGAGMSNSTGSEVDASCNWWGSATGPSGEGPGTGDAVGADILFAPWLVGPAPDGACDGTPRATKQTARAALQALLPSGSKRDDDHLAKAIQRIEESLDARNWADDSTLTTRGRKVFDKEREAVDVLLKVRGVSVEAQVLALVDADRALAEAAIDLAVAGGRRASNIAKAENEMAKGAEDLARGAYEAAIGHFGKAWDHAAKAR